jgi:hypothetical protein
MDDVSAVLDAALYPDVIELGGLPSALRTLAGRRGVDLGDVSAAPGYGPFDAARLNSDRGGIGVVLSPDERRFTVQMSGGGHPWAYGSTDDLTTVVEVAGAWRAGATLRELGARFPFMQYDRMAQAYEEGDQVAARWDHLLHDPDLDTVRPVLRAAHADARLRELFPSVSHLTLVRLVDSVEAAGGEVRIRRSPRGTYLVDASWDETPRDTGTTEEAVAAAVALLRRRPDGS